MMKNLSPLFLILLSFSCQDKKVTPSLDTDPILTSSIQVEEALQDPIPEGLNYAWMSDYDSTQTVANQIPVPKGFSRMDISKGTIGEWLRYLPLQPKGAKVHYYNGRTKFWDVHHRVINMDVGKRDLQQCADAVMRLKAEYHYSKKEYEKIHFNFTSGHHVAFSDWAKGKKPIIKGNSVTFSSGNQSENYRYSNFKKYLISIFSYAGTASLSKELKKKKINNIEAGDVFIQGGFPGHAIMVIDVAEDAEGERAFLLAQSYMPAQEMHILKNPDSDSESPWYSIKGNDVDTPEWDFSVNDLKTWEE